MTVPIDPVVQQVAATIPPINVTVQPPHEGPWYAVPDVWVAIGTISLAIITFFLARYTYKLFAAAQEAHNDSTNALSIAKKALAANENTLEISKNALKVSETNAAAAQRSVSIAGEQMERSLRAYVIVDELIIKKNLDNYYPVIVRIVIINSGQIPATDTVIECSGGIETLVTAASGRGYDHEGTIKQLKGVIGHNQRRELIFEFPESLITKHKDGLNFGGKEIKLTGNIKYLDVVTNQTRTTDFNYVWHTHRGYFTPVEEIGNTMT